MKIQHGSMGFSYFGWVCSLGPCLAGFKGVRVVSLEWGLGSLVVGLKGGMAKALRGLGLQGFSSDVQVASSAFARIWTTSGLGLRVPVTMTTNLDFMNRLPRHLAKPWPQLTLDRCFPQPETPNSYRSRFNPK